MTARIMIGPVTIQTESKASHSAGCPGRTAQPRVVGMRHSRQAGSPGERMGERAVGRIIKVVTLEAASHVFRLQMNDIAAY